MLRNILISLLQKTQPKKTNKKSSKDQKFKYFKIWNFMRLQKKYSNLHERPKTLWELIFFFPPRDSVYFNGIRLLWINTTYLSLLVWMLQQFQNSWIVFSSKGVRHDPWCQKLVRVGLIGNDIPVARFRPLLTKMIQLSRSFQSLNNFGFSGTNQSFKLAVHVRRWMVKFPFW